MSGRFLVLFFAITVLSLLAAINYWIGGKVLLYPPVVFSLIWAVDLILLWSAGDYFYPISAPTLLIFCCGCLVFSVGSALALALPQKIRKEQVFSRSSYHILLVMVMVGVIAVPFCYRWVTNLASGYGGTWLGAARVATLNLETEEGTSLFSVVVVFANLAALLAFCERERHKWLWRVAIVTALALNLMTGGRAGFTILCFSLLCADWFKTHRIRWKLLLVVLLIFVVAFTAIAIYVGKGEASTDLSLAENMKPVFQGFMLYAAGGLVAFDRVVREPSIVPHDWIIYRSVLEVMNTMGIRVEVPPRGADYVTVGPGGLPQNVYTIYFAYLDFGYAGMMAFILAFGFLITCCYRAAMNGSKIALPVYSLLFSGLLLSIFNDSLTGNQSILLRLYLMAWLLYRFPVVWLRFRKFAGRTVLSDAAS